MNIKNHTGGARKGVCPSLMALAFVALAGFTSCESDDTDFSDIINPKADYELRDIQFDSTPLAETETVPEEDNDYVENSDFTRTVTITFADGNATVETAASDITSTIDGAHVTISTAKKGVHYILRGATTDGGLKIYSDRKFKLTLDGVSITNPHGAAINNQGHKSMYVVLSPGTANSLADGTTYNAPVAGEDEKGTLFSEGQVIFSGAGTLSVVGNTHNGIASDDYIVFRPGNVINVSGGVRNCIKAKDGVSIRGGVLNLESIIDGGKAINSEADIDISGGRLTAKMHGGTLIDEATADTFRVAALKCDSNLVMTGGTVSLKSEGSGGRGISANGDVIVSGGSLTVETLGGRGFLTSPKGIKADGKMIFDGGESYVYSANSQPVDADGGVTVASTLTATYSTDGKLLQIKPAAGK